MAQYDPWVRWTVSDFSGWYISPGLEKIDVGHITDMEMSFLVKFWWIPKIPMTRNLKHLELMFDISLGLGILT